MVYWNLRVDVKKEILYNNPNFNNERKNSVKLIYFKDGKAV